MNNTSRSRSATILPIPDFRSLFESAPGLYLVLTPDLRIVAMSDEYLRVTMTKREEILGRGLFEVFPDNPDDPTATGVRNLSASLERVLQNRAPDAMPVQKYDIRRPDSEGGGFEERYWSPVNSPVFGADRQIAYIIHRVEDVTEFVGLKESEREQHRRTEELQTHAESMESEIYLRARQLDEANRQLREANKELARLDRRKDRQLWEYQNRLAMIVDSSQDAIIGKDLEGIITSWNKGAERIYGYTAEEIVGRSITLLAPPDRHPEIARILERIRAGQQIEHFETMRVTKDGKQLDISVSVSPIREATGEIVGASTIARDFTAQRRAEDQLRQAQKMEAMGRLAGGVAHDFNNILGIITACTELLRSDINNEPLPLELVGHIREACKRGASLTGQLLAFSRKQPVQSRVLDLSQRVHDVCKLLRPLMGDDIHVVFHPKSQAALVEADPGHLDQIVLNLAVNSRDAMPHGGKLVIEITTVDFDEAFVRQHPPMEPGRYVMLAISDNGCGMDTATVSRIFEPFFTTKEVGKGTGLGLATVYGIVQQNRGHIWVYSEPGQGTTFRVYLPCADDKAGLARDNEEQVAFPQGGGTTILLVEDDAVMRRLARQILEEQGYMVIEAEDAHSALERTASHRTSLDLVLTDVVMRGMSGPELASRFMDLHPEAKFLYMSGYTGEFVVNHGLSEGIPLLEKPFTRAALLRAIQTTLQTR